MSLHVTITSIYDIYYEMTKIMHHHALHTWYASHGRRDLPWRNTTDAYAIYISEVMLQQTQVQTVLTRYYIPFLQRFPTLQALADAPLEDVLKLWEGLGYYSRARNVHHAARMCAPTLPITIEGLMSLSGIGRNTAHAIAAFAYHQPVPVMEANVKRILYRLSAKETMSEQELWELAMHLVDRDDPFTYNQAMMDIGATICTPTAPKCLLCPLSTGCEGKDAPLAYPAKKAKKQTPTRHRMIIVLEWNGRYYAMPRTTRFLGGLYGFPEYDVAEFVTFAGNEYPMHTMTHKGAIEQIYSHFRLQADIYHYPLQNPPHKEGWFSLDELTQLPLSRADQKVLRFLT
jgi:A/G-specific adenine glycosylase